MRKQEYNSQTGQYEWVDKGEASSGKYGTGDMHKERVEKLAVQNRILETIDRGKMSDYQTQRYLRGIRIRQEPNKVGKSGKIVLDKSEPKPKPILFVGRVNKYDRSEKTVDSVYKEKYLGIKKEKKNRFDKYTESKKTTE